LEDIFLHPLRSTRRSDFEKKAYEDWLLRHSFTDFLTLCCRPQLRDGNGGIITSPDEVRLIHQATAKAYCERLRKKVRGHRRATIDNTLKYLGTLETTSRWGSPTDPHFHFLLAVPDHLRERFDKYNNEIWQQLNHSDARRKPLSVQCDPVWGPAGAIDYAMKFFNYTDYALISNLDIFQ
jgi:hypothetical protein